MESFCLPKWSQVAARNGPETGRKGDFSRSGLGAGLEAVLGWSWGGLGAVLGRPGRLLCGTWGALGRSKIDPKCDPKLDPKTGRIATEKNGPNITPVVVSEVEQR